MSVAAFSSDSVAAPIRRALRNDFVRHSALVFGATMAGNVLNYLFNFAISRRVGVEGFATLSSLVSSVMILSIPASVLTLVVVRYAGTFHAAGDAPRIRRLAYVLLKWTGIVAVGIFAAGMLLRGEVAGFLRIPQDGSIALTLLLIALGFVTPSVRGILQGEQDFLRYAISITLETFLKVALAVALVYAGYGVTGAMAGWFAGTACALGYTVWAVLGKHGVPADSSVRLTLDMHRLIQTTVGVGLATGFLTFISFMDVVLVKHYFGAHQAGLYAAVNLTGKVVLFLVSFVPAVVLPKAVAKSAKGEDAIPLLLQAAGVTLFMGGAALAAFGLFPHEVVRVLAGRDFVAASPYVLQYDTAMCLVAILTVLVNYRIGVHRFGFLYPLAAILACEIVAIASYHRTLWDVIHVLLAGNAIAIVACTWGISPAPVQSRANVELAA